MVKGNNGIGVLSCALSVSTRRVRATPDNQSAQILAFLPSSTQYSIYTEGSQRSGEDNQGFNPQGLPQLIGLESMQG